MSASTFYDLGIWWIVYELNDPNNFFGFLEVGCHFLLSSLVFIVDLAYNELGVTEHVE